MRKVCFMSLMSVVLTSPCYADGNLPLELPPALYAVPGIECNVYFDNLVLTTNSSNYVFDVECAKGRNDAKRWRFTPTDKDVGSYEWKLRVFNETNRLVASGYTTVHVSPADAGSGSKLGLMMVGDSLTDFGYPGSVRERLDLPGNPDSTMLGSHSGHGKPPGRVAHEGRSGWEWKHFTSRWTDDPTGKVLYPKSVFLVERDGKPVLDFQAYCDTHLQGRKPDYITVMLGTNEMINARDETLDAEIDILFAAADKLVAEFKRAAPKVRIGLALTPPPAATQDAFGSNYQCGFSRWEYRRHQFRLVERMLEKYRGGSDSVSLVPIYCGLDCENNFPMVKEALNARNPTQCERLSNGVHPSKDGHQQIADCFYAWLKHQLSQPGN